jgi:ribonuclease J
MARGDHQISLAEGDTVLLASSLIPGNESAIYGIINKLIDRGAKVVHKGNAKVHVSGHASAGELVYCYNIVRPRNAMPVHGESKHLLANAELAIRTGVPPERVVVARDGVTVDLIDGRATISGAVQADLIYVDGHGVGRSTEATLRDRRALRDNGVITVLAIVDLTKRTLAEPLEFVSRGADVDEATLTSATREVTAALARAVKPQLEASDLDDVVAGAVLRAVRQSTRREPVVMALVVEA